MFGGLTGQSSLRSACGAITKKSNLFRYTARVFLLFVLSAITSHPDTPTMSIVTYLTAKTLESQQWSSGMGKIIGMGGMDQGRSTCGMARSIGEGIHQRGKGETWRHRREGNSVK